MVAPKRMAESQGRPNDFIAMIHDVRRRDFFLMKAQIIAYYLTQSRFSSFNPDPCEKMIVNFASETVWETNERSLFLEREPTMIHRKTLE